MGPTQGYQPRNEHEAIELEEYKKLWKNRGLTFTHFEEDHKKRASYIRIALQRGHPLKPRDFGKIKWFEDRADY